MANPEYQSGEYFQPLIRNAIYQIPIVGGFTTGRIRAVEAALLNKDGGGAPETNVHMILENTGSVESIEFDILETDDPISGVRDILKSSISLVPGGEQECVLKPKKRHIEFEGVSGESSLRVNLSSRITFEIQAFMNHGISPFDRDNFPPQIEEPILPSFDDLEPNAKNF